MAPVGRLALAFLAGAALASAARGSRSARGAPSGGRLDFGQLRQLAMGAGFTGEEATIAAAIALAESGGNPRAQLVTAREDSRGLWAINTKAHPTADRERLYQPEYNAATARRVFLAGGWRPWSVWSYDYSGNRLGAGRGVYRRFLPRSHPDYSP